jgi:hypothetical protein
MLKMNFYKSVIDLAGKQTDSPHTLTVSAHGEGVDSLIYNNEQTSFVNLPLNKFAQSSTFEILLNDTLEIITVWHTNYEEYLSFECGVVTCFTIDSLQINGNSIDLLKTNGIYIDSVSIINYSVNIQNAENIKLYHHYDNSK